MINVPSIGDNECFKCCLVRFLYTEDRNPATIIKLDKDFARKLDFKEKKFPVKARDILKIEKKNSIGISVFGYENKKKQPMYQKML